MFNEEEEELNKFNEILLDQTITESPFYESFKEFADKFYKLLRQTKKLVKISDNQQRIINETNEKLTKLADDLSKEQLLSQELLLNILPSKIAEELKLKGQSNPVFYKSVSVMFTDFKGFTQSAERISPEELVSELDEYFTYFDSIMSEFKLEKLKTIGDSYMCAGGIPEESNTHAIDSILAALHLQKYLYDLKLAKIKENKTYWEIRLGIHSGPVVAGVVGRKKFAYDIWGDTVNVASRMESSGVAGEVNVSKETFELTKNFFLFENRGHIEAKNKGNIEMFLVKGVKPELLDSDGKLNNRFYLLYNSVREEGVLIEGNRVIERRVASSDEREERSERRNYLFKFLYDKPSGKN